MTSTTVAGSWTYEWGARKRPFVHPLHTPSGLCLTRNAPEDHPWHHGLWFTIKFVNDENFWEEVPPYGVLRHTTEPEVSSDGLTFEGELHWIRPDRTTVVIRERRRLAHVPIDDHAYAIDFSTELLALADVRFDRTPFTTWGGYGGLSFRGAGEWSDTRLMLDDGSERERVLGETSRWCDLSSEAGGVAFLDHPGNANHPVPWYASTRAATYGDEGWSNFLNAAFLWNGALTVASGELLRLAYRVVVHDGKWNAERVQSAYDEWQAD